MSKWSGRQQMSSAVIAFTLLAAGPVQACWEAAAHRYGVSRELLYAIARTESGMNPAAIGHNADGSHDIGLMQINSTWLPTLAPHGIGESELMEPCTNIEVGAWILADNVQRLGNTWEAVGAYHTPDPTLRRAYAERVYRELLTLGFPTPYSRQSAASSAAAVSTAIVSRLDPTTFPIPPSAP